MAARFLQLHLLTPFAPSNLNRDDLGRPKTAFMGGVERVRISSQCLKHCLRLSDEFKGQVKDLGTRTRYLREHIEATLTGQGWPAEKAAELTKALLSVNKISGSEQDKKDQTVMYNRGELEKLDAILSTLQPDEELYTAITSLVTKSEEDKDKGKGKKGKGKGKSAAPEVADGTRSELSKELTFIDTTHCSVDVALFGRMLAGDAQHNVEAAFQMNHPLTVTAAQIEPDYFTAVDDWSGKMNKPGASHLDVQYFASGLFYTYVNINLDLLRKNLGEIPDRDKVLKDILSALINSLTRVTPSGKQNAFASRSYAVYVLAETGNSTPRSLAAAFYRPVTGSDEVATAIRTLTDFKLRLDKKYGSEFESFCLSIMDEPDLETQHQAENASIKSEENLNDLIRDVMENV